MLIPESYIMPVSSDDPRLRIQDHMGRMVQAIDYGTIANRHVNGSRVIIKRNSGLKNIELDFMNPSSAQLAITNLDVALNELKFYDESRDKIRLGTNLKLKNADSSFYFDFNTKGLTSNRTIRVPDVNSTLLTKEDVNNETTFVSFNHFMDQTKIDLLDSGIDTEIVPGIDDERGCLRFNSTQPNQWNYKTGVQALKPIEDALQLRIKYRFEDVAELRFGVWSENNYLVVKNDEMLNAWILETFIDGVSSESRLFDFSNSDVITMKFADSLEISSNSDYSESEIMGISNMKFESGFTVMNEQNVDLFIDLFEVKAKY